MQMSRNSVMASSHHGNTRDQQSRTSAASPSTLSATGSSKAPMRVNCLRARARMPSSASVIIAPTKTPSAILRSPRKKNAMKTGTAIRRAPVSAFGTFMGGARAGAASAFRPGVGRRSRRASPNRSVPAAVGPPRLRRTPRGRPPLLARTSCARGLALLLDERFDGLRDALAQDQHLADFRRRLLLVTVIQVQEMRHASAVQDGDNHRRERHLLSELRKESYVHGSLLQRPEEVAARLHDQLERARSRQRDGDDLRGLLEAVAQRVPAERNLSLHLEQQRAFRLVTRGAQHD